jgi:lipoprotein-releasing system permease protein
MNRFAFLGLLIGVFAWTSVISIMRGLQDDRKSRVLKEKPHLIWEASPRAGLEAQREVIETTLGSSLASVKMLLQTEGLLEIPGRKQEGRITGSGVIIQGLENISGEMEIGIELMANLMLVEGTPVRLHNVWRMDIPPLESKVARSFETGVYEVDRGSIRVNKKQLEQWLGLNGAISRIEIQLKDPYEAASHLKLLVEKTGLPFKTWQETEASLWYSLKLEMIVMTLAVFFVVLIAAFAVHLALSVRVADKTREIGLLRALGASDLHLSRLYLVEGALLGFFGSLSGLFLGFAFCSLIEKFRDRPEFFYGSSFPVHWSWSLNISLATIAVLMAMLASWWPAQRVKYVEPQEALRS